jgi:hypothetical protein
MHPSLRAARVLLVVCAAWTQAAFAQPLPQLSPPVAQGSTDVPYPAAATGDAVVLLELVVEKDGTVSSAAVIEGAAPFAEQARRTVLTWRFEPARRGETPVAARIRAKVAFHQQESPAPAPATPSSPAAPAPSSTTTEAPPQPPIEVTVLGDRRDIGQTTLSAAEVREMPGAFGDPFRAIEALPGVVPTVSGLPYFYVRGAPPNDNGYYLDGIRVPLLFHVGLAQGVIHPALIERIDFFPGAPPASFGRYAGAIVAGQTRAPATELHGEANLRIVDAGALVEAPLDSGGSTALVAGRYGYPGPILSAITPDVKLGYWDYQARATWQIAERDAIGILGFGSHDYLATKDSGSSESDSSASEEWVEQFVTDFHRVDLRYDRTTAGGRVRVGATVGYDSQGSAPTYVTTKTGAIRVESEQRLSEVVRLRTGADAVFDAYGFRQTAPRPREAVVPSSANPPPTNVTGGLHGDVVWRVSPRVEIVPGARVDLFSSTRSGVTAIVPAFDPRLATRVTLARGLTHLSAFGLSHQYPTLRVGAVPAPVVSVPGFPVGREQLQTAAHGSQGLEIALPANFVLTATGFLSGWSGLTDLTASCVQIEPGTTGPQPEPPGEAPYVCPNDKPVHGRAYGVELLVRRAFSKRWSGWLSYTLSRSTRETRFVTPAGGEAIATVPSEGDRTHVLNALLSYDLGRRWRAGTRFVFFTGQPYSKLDGSVPIPPYNNQRFPPFYRVDVRLEKRWPLGQDGAVAFVIEGQNVTLSKQGYPDAIDCDSFGTPEQTTTTCTHGMVGPITIPSLGVEVFF